MIAAETVVRSWLDTTFTPTRVTTEIPADLTGANIPLIRCWRLGGGRRLILDEPRISVDTFALSRDDSRQLGERVCDALQYQLVGQTVGGLHINRVVVIQGPSWAPWDNSSVRRFTALYTVYVKPV